MNTLTDEASGIREVQQAEESRTPRVSLLLAAVFAFDFLLAMVLIAVGLFFFFRHLITS